MSTGEPLGEVFEELRERGDLRRECNLRGDKPPRAHLPPHQMLYCLPDCGCVFTLDALEKALLAQVSRSDDAGVRVQQPPTTLAIHLLQCPHCRERIFTASRFERMVKQQLRLYQALKVQLKLPDPCKGMPLDPLALHEVRKAGLQAGMWFACPNGHLYRIEDKEGSQTGIAQCPECQKFIGASHGQIQPGNRFISLDSDRPAYKSHGMSEGMPPLPPLSSASSLANSRTSSRRIMIMSNSGSNVHRKHYEWVAGHFADLFPSLKVKYVEMILNPGLMDRYEEHKAMFLRRGYGEERLVYHGTHPRNHELIAAQGLKVGGRDVLMATGNAYGSGIYVGTEPDTALGYARGSRAFLFCAVLMGNYTDSATVYKSGAGTQWDALDMGFFCVAYKEEQVLPCYIVHTE